jgi:hypothetical protein
MRVRRETAGGAGDDDEADIAFDSGVISLDSAISNASAGVTATTLGQFLNVGTVGGTTYTNPDSLTVTASCFVDEWKDQSENANHATQGTFGSQPQIHSGTVNTDLITENGKPALQWDGTNTFLRNSTSRTSGAHTVVSVNKYTQEANENALYDSDTSPQTIAYINSTNKWIIEYGGTFSTGYTADTNQHLLTFIIDGSSTVMYEDGTSIATGNPGTNNMSGLTIGAARNAGVPWNGTIQEMILWDSDQSGNRAAIESNINGFFSIYP